MIHLYCWSRIRTFNSPYF